MQCTGNAEKAMDMRILLIGAGGFFGQRATVTLAPAGEVLPLTHRDLDITDRTAVEEALSSFRPQGAVLAAAISDTGYTQKHPEEAYAINVRGAENVARACEKIGTKLLYMSSDQVYNGCLEAGPLPEDTPLCPETEYGRQKALCEERVQAACPGAVGLRLTWMYDRPDAPGKNAGLLKSLWTAGQSGSPLTFATREYRGVTNVWRVAEALPGMWALPGGVYNCGAGNMLHTWDTALAAARMLGLPEPEKLVLPDRMRYAAHPRNLLMDTGRLAGFGIRFTDTLTGFRDTLEAETAPAE